MHQGDRSTSEPPEEAQASAVERRAYDLTDGEVEEFRKLPSWEPRAGYLFWMRAAERRGLDYASIIGNPNRHGEFTGLPMGHGLPWCHPAPLQCAEPPRMLSEEFHRPMPRRFSRLPIH